MNRKTNGSRATEIDLQVLQAYADLIQTSPDAMVLFDHQGRFQYFNPAAERLSGFSAGEVLGRTVTEIGIVHPAELERVEGEIARALSGEERSPFELAIVRRDGDTVVMDVHLHVPHRNGRVIGVQMSLRDITARKEAEEALRESQERFQSAFTYAAIGVALVGLDGHWIRVNRSLCELVGYSEQELLQMSFQDITHPDDLDIDLGYMQQLLRGEIRTYDMEKRYIHPDGHLVWVLLNVSLVHDAEGQPLYFISQVQDISRRKQAEFDLVAERALLDAVLNGTGDNIFAKDLSGRYVLVNDAAAAAVGKRKEDILGKDARSITPEEGLDIVQRHEQEVLRTGETQVYELSVHDRGEPKVYLTTKSPYRDHQGRIIGLVGVEHDITDRRRMEQLLDHLAHYDPLTDLPNRRLFQDRLRQAVEHARRYRETLAVLFVDLDGFKTVNDTFGHECGDRALQAVGTSLLRAVRRSDTVTRLAGDEFAVILLDIQSPADAEAVARSVLTAVREVRSVGDWEIEISASVGISLYPEDGGNPDTLLRNADRAMYRAKDAGKATYRFFNADGQA